MTNYTTLFLDIGGVILTNGWDNHCRDRAAQVFGLDRSDFEERHKQYYDLLETDKITLDDYLNKVIFWKKRDFTVQQFKEFMFSQSKPIPEMIKLLSDLKNQFHLRIATVSNESREISAYRIKTFNLRSFVDDFFISCYVGYQKPDPHIYLMALDITQVNKEEVIYIDDRPNLIEAAKKLGIHSIQNVSFETTRDQLLQLLKAPAVNQDGKDRKD